MEGRESVDVQVCRLLAMLAEQIFSRCGAVPQQEITTTSTRAGERLCVPSMSLQTKWVRRRRNPRVARSSTHHQVIGKQIMSWRCDSFHVIAVRWSRQKEKKEERGVVT